MMKKDNKVENKKAFERDWSEYILGFEDNYIKNEEWNANDRDLEAYYIGVDMSSQYLSQGDKIRIKRYRREDCKR